MTILELMNLGIITDTSVRRQEANNGSDGSIRGQWKAIKDRSGKAVLQHTVKGGVLEYEYEPPYILRVKNFRAPFPNVEFKCFMQEVYGFEVHDNKLVVQGQEYEFVNGTIRTREAGNPHLVPWSDFLRHCLEVSRTSERVASEESVMSEEKKECDDHKKQEKRHNKAMQKQKEERTGKKRRLIRDGLIVFFKGWHQKY